MHYTSEDDLVRMLRGPGCSTEGYDASTYANSGGRRVSSTWMRRHQQDLPSFLRLHERHVTRSPDLDIVTVCTERGLKTIVEFDDT